MYSSVLKYLKIDKVAWMEVNKGCNLTCIHQLSDDLRHVLMSYAHTTEEERKGRCGIDR